jgi:putative membrane protein
VNEPNTKERKMNRTLNIALMLCLISLGLSCSENGNRNATSNANNRNSTVTPPANSNSRAALSSADSAFIVDAARGGMMEVELGQLAVQQAASADVKRFGQRMIDDHSKANNELKQLAASKNVTLPADLNPKQKEMKDKLIKLKGAGFDREYMKVMVEDHAEDVTKFEGEGKNASDPDVKAFATKTLPTLREHLQLAREVAKKVGVSVSE